MNLTEQKERKLAEFLGEYPPHGPAIYATPTGTTSVCSICGLNTDKWQDVCCRLNFTDWRVVGRLIEKVEGHVCIDRMKGRYYINIYVDAEENCCFDGNSTSLAEAICRAVLAYIKEGGRCSRGELTASSRPLL